MTGARIYSAGSGDEDNLGGQGYSAGSGRDDSLGGVEDGFGTRQS